MHTFRSVRFLCLATGFICLCATQGWSTQQPHAPAQQNRTSKSTPPNSEQGPHLSGEEVTLPLLLVHGYPFIHGSINGVAGDLMFDTGMASSLVLNTRAVTPPNGHLIGQGSFTSGQKYPVLQFPVVDRLDLPNGLLFENLRYTLGYPGVVIEHGVDPKYIGSLGVGFFDGYVFKLNYAARSLTFFRNDESDRGEKRAEASETFVLTLKFDRDWHTSLLIAGTPTIARLDTGSPVGITLTSRQLAAMEHAGALRKTGHDRYLLSELVIQGEHVAPMLVDVTVNRSPAQQGAPTADEPVITFGFEFLSQYTTLWDYQRKTLTLLQAKAAPANSQRGSTL